MMKWMDKTKPALCHHLPPGMDIERKIHTVDISSLWVQLCDCVTILFTVLAAVTALEKSLFVMQKTQKNIQREHEKGVYIPILRYIQNDDPVLSAMCDVRERHRLELSRESERLHNQILTLSELQLQEVS